MRYRTINKKKPPYTVFGEWLFRMIEALESADHDIVASFARRVSISRAQLYRYFVGTKTPSLAALVRMCSALDVSLDVGLRMYRRSYTGKPRLYGTSPHSP